jgi:hypothetical protein
VIESYASWKHCFNGAGGYFTNSKFLTKLIGLKQRNNETNICRVCGRQWKKTIKLLKKVLTQALRKIRWTLVQSVTRQYL